MTTIICSLRKLPLVINIQDIYPESLVSLNKVSPTGILVKIFKAIDSWVVSKAQKVIVPSENFADFYQNIRLVSKEKIHIIYNWLNENEIKPSPRIGIFREMLGICTETFVIMYAGNIGMVAGVDLVIEVAKELRNHKDILFVIAGSGTCKSECEKLLETYQLINVRIFSPLPQELFCDVQGAADLMILPTKDSGSLTSVPSKLISYMLACRAVLACVAKNSDTAKIIKKAECGIVVSHQEISSIAEKIRILMGKNDELQEMGRNGHDYAIKNFSSKACLPKLVEIVETTLLS
jgi:glycosyltransferase involved in cell wall biosynthesis